MSRLPKGALLLLLLASAAHAQDGGVPALLLPLKSEWRYRVGDAPADWMQPAYDDERWKLSASPLGYGEPEVPAPLPDNPLAFYARRRFELRVLPSEVQRLNARVDFDDGFVLFLNGREVLRRNLPANQTFTTPASTGHESGSPSDFDLTANTSLLVAGENLLAVEVHNEGPGSDDALLEVEVRATLATAPAPQLRNLSPALGETDVSPNTTISFELVDATGVDPGELFFAVQAEPVQGQLSGSPELRSVTYAPPIPFPSGATVAVEVGARNRAGVTLPPFRWTFRTAAPASPPGSAPGCGCASAPAGTLALVVLVAWRGRRRMLKSTSQGYPIGGSNP